MKRIIVAILLLLGMCICYCNAEVRFEGKNLIQTSSVKSQAEQTEFTYEYNGEKYAIFVNPKTGRCFVNMVSKKTGKPYKKYLDEASCKYVCQQLGITYVETKK